MRKFTQINENVSPSSELEMGIKIEKEHGDIYKQLDSYLESFNVSMPWIEDEFYKKIAEAHLREMPDYYTKLKTIEQ